MKGGSMEDVCRALQERKQKIPTPMKSKLVSSEPEEHVKHVVDIVLPLTGPESPFTPEAITWSQTKDFTDANPYLWAFQLMVLLCETVSYGSCIPIPDRETHSSHYYRVVDLLAREKIGKLKNTEREVLRKHIKFTRFVNLRFLIELENRIQFLTALASSKAKPKTKQPTKEEKEAQEGDDEHADLEKDYDENGKKKKKKKRARSEKSKSKQPPRKLLKVDLSSLSKRVSFCLKTFPEDFLSLFDVIGDSLIKEKETADKVMNQAPEDEDPVEQAVEWDGPEVFPKVQFTVTPVPLVGREGAVGALYCRFLIRDPGINPGEFFQDVLRNLNERKAHELSGGGRARLRPDLFASYVPFFHSNHPCGNSTSEQVYYKVVTQVCPEVAAVGNDNMNTAYNNMKYMAARSNFHFYNVFSTKNAIEMCTRLGCLPTRIADWIDYSTGQINFPPRLQTFKYVADMVFWYNRNYLGLYEQYFPHADGQTDFISAALLGGSLDKFIEHKRPNATDRQPMRRAVDEYIENSWSIERRKVSMSSCLGYDTTNELMHIGAEAARVYERVLQEKPSHLKLTYRDIQRLGPNWRNHLTDNDDLARRVFECERYNDLVQEMQRSFLKIFETLWILEGNVKDVAVSDPLKIMLKWYIDKKFPHMTRDYIMWDPEMGMFGNSMLRNLFIYSKVGKVLQPMTCIISEGLFSAYTHERTLNFHIMAHGRYDVGKTFMLISILLGYTCIPGTVQEYTSRTSAADTTAKHVYDAIIASDETMDWKVDEQAAKKHRDLESKEKVKMTKKQVGHLVFSQVQVPSGEKVRWNDLYTTDHFDAKVEVTNAVAESKNALSSRYHRISVFQSKIPASELEGYMASGFKSDSRDYLHINQYLSALVYKAIQCGVIIPPDLQLFTDVISRMRVFLKERKIMGDAAGNRFVETMTGYARQMVIHHAITCAFDMPGGPCYRQPFTVASVRHVQPYMYANTEIVFWCCTALGQSLTHDDYHDVLNSIPAVFGFDWDFEDDAYGNYELDVHNRIRFRVVENPSQPDRKADDAKLVDLNYVFIPGSFRHICGRIAARTGMGQNDVEGILRMLSDNYFEVNNSYEPQPVEPFNYFHKYRENVDGKLYKNVQDPARQLPASFLTPNNPNPEEPRTKEDVPRVQAMLKLPIVDLTDMGQNKGIYINLQAAIIFKKDTIISALLHATMHKNFPTGKMLLGITNPNKYDQLKVINFTEDMIARMVRDADEAEGWDVRGNWIGDPNTPPEARPTRRMVGLPFNRRANMHEKDLIMFTTLSGTPLDEEKTEQWKQRRSEESRLMEGLIEVYSDLDEEAALRHHLNSGQPLDEPVKTPRFIRERYLKACAEMEREHTKGLQYPEDWKDLDSKAEMSWKASNQTKSMSSFDMYTSLLHNSTTVFGSLQKNNRKRLQVSQQARPATFLRPGVPAQPQPQPQVVAADEEMEEVPARPRILRDPENIQPHEKRARARSATEIAARSKRAK
jgi:hypothetical protein